LTKSRIDWTTLSTQDRVKLFVKLLNTGDHSKNNHERFRDFIEMAYCAHAKAATLVTTKDQAYADSLEERYMRVVGTYRDPDMHTVREVFPELLAMCTETVVAGGCDFLGMIAAELGALSDDMGQFFTPFQVSRMMASMTLGDCRTTIEQEGYITIEEPAAGAGSMVIACADVLEHELGLNPVIHMLVRAIDVSHVAYQMCYLQLTWRGIPALVQRANSLSMEVFEGAYTLAAVFFAKYHGHVSFVKPDRSSGAAQREEAQRIVNAIRAIWDLLEAEEPPDEAEPVYDSPLIQYSMF
jgi:hypothetical protein